MLFSQAGVFLGAVLLSSFARAQNFSTYEPPCVTTCVEKTFQNNNTCTSLDDNKCLCNNFVTIVLPSIGCFLSTCQHDSEPELRSQVTSAWEKFCNDSGYAISFPPGGPWGGGRGGPGSGGSPFPTSLMPNSSVTPTSTSPTSTPASSSTSPSEATAPATTENNANSGGLTTGAKAGIGVGAGVGALAVIGSLLFLGFRLGQQRKHGSNDGSDSSFWPFFGSGKDRNNNSPEDGLDATDPTKKDVTTAEGGAEYWGDKPQLEGQALAELSSHTSPPEAELHGREVGELPVQESLVELGGGHGEAPYYELSQDAEVPRGRILQQQQGEAL